MNIAERIKAVFRGFRASEALGGRLLGEDTQPTAKYGDYFTTSAAVYRCVMLRATNIARPTMRVYQRRGAEELDQPDHPLAKLLTRPNPFWTGKQLWRAAEADLCWYGNAYWAIETRGGGEPLELWRLRPDWVQVVPDTKEYITGYIYTVAGRDYAWDANKVIHFRYTNPFNEYYGMAPARAAQYAIEMGTEAIKYNRYFFQNLAVPALVLWTEQPLGADQSKKLLNRWNEALQGPLRAGKTAILHSGLKPAPLTISQKDAEWLNALKWSLEDTARVYGVPAPLVGEERAVYKNIIEAEAALWHETLIPEVDWITDILNAKLAPKFGTGLVVAADLSMVEALQDDMANLTSRYAALLDRGAMTINEARRKLHLGADVPWGRQAWMPLNFTPVSTAGEPVRAPKSAKPNGDGGTETGGGKTPPVEATTAPNPRAILPEEGLLPKVATRDVNGRIVGTLAEEITRFFAREAPKIAGAYGRETRQAGYDWGVWQRDLTGPMVEATVAQLVEAAVDAYHSVVSGSFDLVNLRAGEWATANAGKQIADVTKRTQETVARITAQATEEGWARDRIVAAIMDNPAFNQTRALLIARTETERAYNQGNLRGYRESGIVTEKGWIGAGDCCDGCVANMAQGFILLGVLFASGDDAPPAHPNCRCRIIPRVAVPEGAVD